MTIDAPQDACVIVCARNEAACIGATLRALRLALPHALVLVADDGSTDDTARIAREHEVQVVSHGRPLGKGGTASLAATRALEQTGPDTSYLLCDGDLGDSAGNLPALLDHLGADSADLVVAAFVRRTGGGFGIAVAFAAWAIRSLTGRQLTAPISGQRALSRRCLEAVLPFAPRFGMEIGMTVDALRAGMRVQELELALEHRATGRTAAGFVHRLRQLLDFFCVYLVRRLSFRRSPR